MLGFFPLVHVWMIFQRQFMIHGFNYSLRGGVRHILVWEERCVTILKTAARETRHIQDIIK